MKIPENPPDLEKIDLEKIYEYLGREDITNFIKKANREYFYWDDLKYRARFKDTDRELLWKLIKYTRKLAMTPITVGKDNKIVLNYSCIDKISRKLHKFDLILGGFLGTPFVIPSEDKDRYLINSIMEESIASSQLEGAAVTRKIAKEMLRKQRKPRDKHEQMILNNYQTIQKILGLVGKKLTPKIIKEIHESITSKTLDSPMMEGKLRKSNDVYVIDNRDGKILYTPPDCRDISELLTAFCDFANEKKQDEFIHPIVKASILHFLMGYIHPFEDGNGRTARAIFYWYVLSEGYWLFQYMSISRIIIKSPSQYARAYIHTEKDDFDVTYFVLYQVNKIELAVKELKIYIDRQIKRKRKIYNLLMIEEFNDRQAYLIGKFSMDSMKVITIKEMKNTFGVSYETARKDLFNLEKLGYIKRKIKGKKKLLFVKSDDFEILLKKRNNK